VLATTASENKLRYKPLPTARRQFLHILADDFGFESISQDVEPYRYVVISKGPRFVAAPNKTIAQCIKIRETQAAEAAAAEAAASRAPSPPPVIVPTDPYNGFLLTTAQFGLTVDEVRATLREELAAQPSLSFAIDFLPSDEVLLRATAHYSAFLNPIAMEQTLTHMRPQVEATVKKSSIAAGVLLCHAESGGGSSGVVIARRENLHRQDTSGWNAVAGKAAVKKATAPMPADDTASRGSRGKVTLGRKKKIEPKKETSWTSSLSGDAEC
jgi:transcriptional repressor NF-X1